jgi:hypothetical protein
LLIKDMQKSIHRLQKNPPTKSLTRTAAGGYNHN